MPVLSVDVPGGAVATAIGQAALVWWIAKHAADSPMPPAPTGLVAAQEMVRDYLRSVYRQHRVNGVAATAQATVAAEETAAAAAAGGIA